MHASAAGRMGAAGWLHADEDRELKEVSMAHERHATAAGVRIAARASTLRCAPPSARPPPPAAARSGSADDDFADWPLGERAVDRAADALGRSRTASLTVLARSFERSLRRHARFVEWRRSGRTSCECRTSRTISRPAQMPTLLLAPGIGIGAVWSMPAAMPRQRLAATQPTRSVCARTRRCDFATFGRGLPGDDPGLWKSLCGIM